VKQGSAQTGWQWLGQQRINERETNKIKKTAVCTPDRSQGGFLVLFSFMITK